MFSSLFKFQLPRNESYYLTNPPISRLLDADETSIEVSSFTSDETPSLIDTLVSDPSTTSLNVSQELASSSNDNGTSSVSATNPTLHRSSRVS